LAKVENLWKDKITPGEKNTGSRLVLNWKRSNPDSLIAGSLKKNKSPRPRIAAVVPIVDDRGSRLQNRLSQRSVAG